MHVWAITDRGAVRQENQDTYSVCTPMEDRCFAVVCDGMGGAKAGNVASKLAADTLLEVLGQIPAENWVENPGEILENGLTQANEVIFRRAITDADCEGMGTTMVGAMMLGTKAHILNVGDSRAYYISRDDGIHRITRDHSLVEDMVIRGELSPEEARVHPQKNLITKALGVVPEIEGDYYEVDLKDGDCILLCSDGLSNLMDDQEISYEVLYGEEMDTCCQRLLDLSMSRGAPDNVTVVLLQK